jgi:predicted ABC-class ATPase
MATKAVENLKRSVDEASEFLVSGDKVSKFTQPVVQEIPRTAHQSSIKKFRASKRALKNAEDTQKFEELEKLSQISSCSERPQFVSKSRPMTGNELETSSESNRSHHSKLKDHETSQFFDSHSLKASSKFIITNPEHLKSSSKYHPLV